MIKRVPLSSHLRQLTQCFLYIESCAFASKVPMVSLDSMPVDGSSGRL